MNSRLNKPGLNKFIPVDPITIKEPLNKDLKTFESTDEFTVFYRQNDSLFKDPVKNTLLSANVLNRLYSVPGYKISVTKRGTDNEELILIKDYRSKYATGKNNQNNNSETDNLNNELLTSLMNKIDILTQRVNNIESFLEQLQR
jgi:hypothetical protein